VDGPGSFISYLLTNLGHLRDAWTELFVLEHVLLFAFLEPVLVVIAVLALVATVIEALRGRVVAHYVLAYLAVVALWPYPTHYARFLVPVLPFLVAMLVAGVLGLGRVASAAPKPVLAGVVLILLAVALPTDVEMLRRADGSRPALMADHYRMISRAYGVHVAGGFLSVIDDFERIDAEAPPKARILALKPHFGAVLARRAFVLTPDHRRFADGDAFADAVCRSGDHLYLSRLTRADRAPDAETLDRLVGVVTPLWERRDTDGAFEAGFYALETGCADHRPSVTRP